MDYEEKKLRKDFENLQKSINEYISYNDIDSKIKRLCNFFEASDLSFINSTGNGYSIYLDYNRCSYGRTIQDVVNDFIKDYEKEIKEIEEEKEAV